MSGHAVGGQIGCSECHGKATVALFRCAEHDPRAIAAQAQRFVAASEAHESRDWNVFETNDLGAVTVEYAKLVALVQGSHPIRNATDQEDP